MQELSFDISKFIVTQVSGFELGIGTKYGVQFTEYYIPVEMTDYIDEVKSTNISYIELSNGAIHFCDICYYPSNEDTEIETEGEVE